MTTGVAEHPHLGDDGASARLRYSIVVPVYNEGANIGTFCRRVRTELPPHHEVLVCYDFEGDDTLAVLSRLPVADTAGIRLVRNTLGPGVRGAIESGLRAAAAPVVIVMMADLSDDFGRVEEMVARAEAGATVVCASRYMRGGRQLGGPVIKGVLSRTAGVTLRWLAGLPTHDPTNSFKAYRQEFLARTRIQSTTGFCLAMELTVKAHFTGARVEEVPATWHDRRAGRSRFKLLGWLPHYTRWYLWAVYRRWLG